MLSALHVFWAAGGRTGGGVGDPAAPGGEALFRPSPLRTLAVAAGAGGGCRRRRRRGRLARARAACARSAGVGTAVLALVFRCVRSATSATSASSSRWATSRSARGTRGCSRRCAWRSPSPRWSSRANAPRSRLAVGLTRSAAPPTGRCVRCGAPECRPQWPRRASSRDRRRKDAGIAGLDAKEHRLQKSRAERTRGQRRRRGRSPSRSACAAPSGARDRPGVAPSTSRIPISRVRRVTPCAVTTSEPGERDDERQRAERQEDRPAESERLELRVEHRRPGGARRRTARSGAGRLGLGAGAVVNIALGSPTVRNQTRCREGFKAAKRSSGRSICGRQVAVVDRRKRGEEREAWRPRR